MNFRIFSIGYRIIILRCYQEITRLISKTNENVSKAIGSVFDAQTITTPSGISVSVS